MKIVEIFIRAWQKGFTFPCPSCGDTLEQPYECKKCNIQVKLKMKF